MKWKLDLIFLAGLLQATIALHGQTSPKGMQPINCCVVRDSDSAYNKRAILHQFAATLNEEVYGPGTTKKRFAVNDHCQMTGAFIWDLTDTINKAATFQDCIRFREGHVYHFSPMDIGISYSNIAILSKGNLKIFKAVNCTEKGDRIETVIQYVKDHLAGGADDDHLIKRISNYRKYGVYIRVDELSVFRCR
jgi:hypothetical protein